MLHPCVQPRWFPAGLLVVALAACHDAPRDNPFDPELTSAVEMEMTLDDTAGTVTLTWTPYEGEQPFAEYWVLRKRGGMEAVDTLAVLSQMSQTIFVDSSLAAHTDYVYRVSVVNTSGFEQSSDEKTTPGYAVTAVTLLEVEVNQEKGEVKLRWSRFREARFEVYRLERRSQTEANFTPVAWVEAVSDTVFTDEDPVPNVTYFYRIVVEAAGENWESNLKGPVLVLPSDIQLLEGDLDLKTGTLLLHWQRYTGPGFEQYEVRRSRLGEGEEVLGEITAVADITWTDSTLLPSTFYSYQVRTVAENQEQVTQEFEVVYDLPPAYFQRVIVSYPGIAELHWRPYQGPRFEAYEVRRKVEVEGETIVRTLAEFKDINRITYVDSQLQSDTEYAYCISVRTSWGEDVGVLSRELRGRFLALRFVISILEDSEGALWFGTDQGVSRYDGRDWQFFGMEDGLAGGRHLLFSSQSQLGSGFVPSVYQSSDGAMWFGTAGGVSRYDGSWQTFTEADGLAGTWVTSVYESSDGAMWFGTTPFPLFDEAGNVIGYSDGGGVSRYDGSWQTFTEADGLASNWVYSVYESSDGAMWFGAFSDIQFDEVNLVIGLGDGGGVSRYDGTSWQTFTQADGLASGVALPVYQSSDGAMWFGTDQGVSRYDGSWQTFR